MCSVNGTWSFRSELRRALGPFAGRSLCGIVDPASRAARDKDDDSRSHCTASPQIIQISCFSLYSLLRYILLACANLRCLPTGAPAARPTPCPPTFAVCPFSTHNHTQNRSSRGRLASIIPIQVSSRVKKKKEREEKSPPETGKE